MAPFLSLSAFPVFLMLSSANTSPTLHMLCGKIASGKSTLASKLAKNMGSTRSGGQQLQNGKIVLISQDTWLGALFSDQMSTGSDYVRCASKLQTVMGPHISSLLTAGISVVLDFPANTVESRSWMRDVFEDGGGASHQLHVLDTPDEICLARLRDRNALGEHPFSATEEQFHQFCKYFEMPSPEEGFNLVIHDEFK